MTAITLASSVSAKDRDLIHALIDNTVSYYRARRFESVYRGLSLLHEAIFTNDTTTFQPEQLHPHFVDLLPDLKTWLDSESPTGKFWPTRVDKDGLLYLMEDLSERRKLNEIFV